MSRQSKGAARSKAGGRAPRGTSSGPRPTHGSARRVALNGEAAIAPVQADRLERIAWLVIALFAAVLLVVVLGPHRIGDYSTETDFYGAYAAGARLLQHGHFDPSRYGVVGPVYEMTLAAFGLVTRDLFAAAEWISWLAMVLAVFLWHRLLTRLGGARLGLVTVLLLVTSPFVFRYGYTVSTDALAFALQAAALERLLAGRGRGTMVAAGLLSAAALLTRYSALYLLPVGLAVTLVRQDPAAPDTARADAPARPRLSGDLVAFALAFIVPVSAWSLLAMVRGGLALQLHHNIAYEVYAHARGIGWDDYQRTLEPHFHSLADVVARDPGAFFARMLFNLFDHLRQDATNLLGWPVAACAVAGAALAVADRFAGRAWPLGLAGLLLYLSLVPVFYSERYALPLLPVYLTLAGWAFASPRLALAVGRRHPVWLKLVLLVPVLAWAVQASVTAQRDRLAQQPIEVVQSAETLRALAAPGDRVIARKPHLAFHAGLDPVPFPFTHTLTELADYARANHARWLYISWPEAVARPDYQLLFDTTAAFPGLTARRVTSPRPSVLYEIGPGFGADPAWMANDTLVAIRRAHVKLLFYPRDIGALTTLAFDSANRGHFDEARTFAERAVAAAPDDASANLLLGQIVMSQGDGARAAALLERALALAQARGDREVEQEARRMQTMVRGR